MTVKQFSGCVPIETTLAEPANGSSGLAKRDAVNAAGSHEMITGLQGRKGEYLVLSVSKTFGS